MSYSTATIDGALVFKALCLFLIGGEEGVLELAILFDLHTGQA